VQLKSGACPLGLRAQGGATWGPVVLVAEPALWLRARRSLEIKGAAQPLASPPKWRLQSSSHGDLLKVLGLGVEPVCLGPTRSHSSSKSPRNRFRDAIVQDAGPAGAPPAPMARCRLGTSRAGT